MRGGSVYNQLMTSLVYSLDDPVNFKYADRMKKADKNTHQNKRLVQINPNKSLRSRKVGCHFTLGFSFSYLRHQRHTTWPLIIR